MTATTFIVGSSGHFTLGASGTVRWGTHDVFYVETGPGHTDIQLYGAGGQIRFKDSSGNTVAAINPTNHSFAFADNSTVLHDALYDSNNDLVVQMINNSNKIFFKDASGNSIGSIDSSGNLRMKGTITASTTP